MTAIPEFTYNARMEPVPYEPGLVKPPVARPTIRDVAQKAGVGVGTVSRVLNDSPLVSEATRQRVTEAIEALSFRPSSVARQLSTGGRSLAVGVVAPFFTRPAFVGRLQGIEAAFIQSDYDLILYNVETPEQRDEVFHRIPRDHRVDGLIAIALRPTDHQIDVFKRAEIPLVLLDTHHPALCSIRIDDEDGARQATGHLADLGHTRIAYVSDRLDGHFGFQASRRRYDGYRAVLAERGIPFREGYHQQGDFGRHTAHRLADELMTLPEPPTAIFAASDTQALGVMEAIRQRGLRIPEDISVVGYDDIEIAAYIGLTTIHQPFYQSGVESADTLSSLLTKNGEPNPLTTLPVELIVRHTTAAPHIN